MDDWMKKDKIKNRFDIYFWLIVISMVGGLLIGFGALILTSPYR